MSTGNTKGLAKYHGTCEGCKKSIIKGYHMIVKLQIYEAKDKSFFHTKCGEGIKETKI